MPTSDEPVQPTVDELKRMLELELDARARPYQGCWPFVVAVAGLLLAAVLLLAWL
jgi:hypothetical protein